MITHASRPRGPANCLFPLGLDDDSGAECDSCIDERYVSTLTFVGVRTCKMCLHASNELNPITAGPFKRTKNLPCWPWKKGSYKNPEKNYCRLCHYVHELGGYNSSHGTIQKCHEKLQNSDTLADEWRACLGELILLTNKGKIKIRLCGNKRINLMKSLVGLRAKTCEIVKSSGVQAKELFKAILLSKWLERNPNQDPRAQGHVAICLEFSNFAQSVGPTHGIM